MIINLKIEDSLYDKYLTTFGAPKHYAQMKRAIEEFSGIKYGERTVILHGDERRELEAIFQTTIDDPAKLIRLTKNLHSVRIDGIAVDFTPDELARIEMQASFHGRSTETFIKEMISEIKDRMLEKV